MKGVSGAAKSRRSISALIGCLIRADLSSGTPFLGTFDSLATGNVIWDIQIVTARQITLFRAGELSPLYWRASHVRSTIVEEADIGSNFCIAIGGNTLQKGACSGATAPAVGRS